jgi:hypothetical protein
MIEKVMSGSMRGGRRGALLDRSPTLPGARRDRSGGARKRKAGLSRTSPPPASAPSLGAEDNHRPVAAEDVVLVVDEH